MNKINFDDMSNKKINEFRYLADEMEKAISTEYKRRILEDERKLEAVLNENGWRKAPEVASEIFAEIEEGVKAAVSALQFENNPIHRQIKREAYSSFMRFIKTIEKKYTEGEGEWIADINLKAK